MRRCSISLCAWAYNEEDLIEEFVRKTDEDLKRVSDDYEIIVVDDCSTDTTWQRLQTLKEKYPILKIVRHPKNFDVGYGFRTAIPLATKEIITWNTIDMFYDTRDLPRFLQYMDSYDLLQGVRSDLRANAPARRLTTLVNYHLIRFLFGIPLSEFQNVKLVRKTLMDQIQLESGSIFTNAEIGIKAYYLGARIKEVEMTFHGRKRGKAKGARLKSLAKTFRDILWFWWKWRILGQIKRTTKSGTIDPLPKKSW